MKYVVDTNIINRLVDGTIGIEELPTEGTFVASHIQIDEINRTKNSERRKKLLEKFAETVDEILPTDSFVLDFSVLDDAKLGDGQSYELLKTELDKRNRNKPNNSNDAAYSGDRYEQRLRPVNSRLRSLSSGVCAKNRHDVLDTGLADAFETDAVT